MANKALFTSGGRSKHAVPATNTVNRAGGVAYTLSDKEALAQYAATCMFGQMYYASGSEQLDEVLVLANKVDVEFLAKIAIYSRKNALLKDVPALLVAVLATRDTNLFKQVFPKVIDNARMVRNFVQIMRSGKVGRKSLGSASKRAVQAWFAKQTDDQIFRGSVGNDPSMGDVLKLVHPKPETKAREALYAYIMGKEYDAAQLPKLVQEFESFKKNPSSFDVTPDVPFQMLTSLGLTTKHWTGIAKNAGWQMLRMNLNTFERHGVFGDHKVLDAVAARLSDAAEIAKARQYPYQIYTALQAAGTKNIELNLALQTALDHSMSNVPKLSGNTVICLDNSGSMHALVSGKGTTTCLQAGALFATALLRANPTAKFVIFNDKAQWVSLNPRDSVYTNIKKILGIRSGGTAISAPFALSGFDWADNVIIISDNESWVDSTGKGRPTALMSKWTAHRSKKKDAKMILMDLAPNAHSQAANDRKDILKVGGFSDSVFDVVGHFLNNQNQGSAWVEKIESMISL